MTEEDILVWMRAQAEMLGADACWPWGGPLNQDGYARVYFQGGKSSVPHLVLRLSGRPRPAGLHALHSCDNRPCCNPSHLSWGSHKQNMKEMAERGRAADKSGQANGRSVLNDEDVRAIRVDPRSQRLVARQYRVSQVMVGKIRRRESWAHVA